MFSDYLFFLMLLAMPLVHSMLAANAMSFMIQCANPALLHPTLESRAPLYQLLFTLRNFGVRYRHNFRSGESAAEENRNLLSQGRRASANGKEGTSC
jgi:hypothetical protein